MKAAGRGRIILITATALVVIAWALNPSLCPAQPEGKDRPVRSIFMVAEYPGVQVPGDENLSMDIIFHCSGGKTGLGLIVMGIVPGLEEIYCQTRKKSETPSCLRRQASRTI